MGSLEMTCHECGGRRGSLAVSNDGTDENLCFSRTEEGPSSSQSYTAANGSNQDPDYTDCVVDIENGVDEVRISVEKMERECRICMMSLDSESGIAIELGCSCKDGMEAAHQHCAETWFRSKGNNICEICHSIARNVVVPNNITSRQHTSQVSPVSTNAVSVPVNANTVATFSVPAPVYQVNTSTNAYSVPRSNVNSLTTTAVPVPVSSTNAVSVPVSAPSNMPRSNVNSLSTTAVSVPVSSASDNEQCSICCWVVVVIFFLFFVWPTFARGAV
ncbi:uncharacterized protein LOC141693910 [Apium graveolens]|uniref:uncharacterized protein LOC141693910 n=1 Tax=Apium graveolens TaxID=4045 RepID=UPI003D79BAAA